VAGGSKLKRVLMFLHIFTSIESGDCERVPGPRAPSFVDPRAHCTETGRRHPNGSAPGSTLLGPTSPLPARHSSDAVPFRPGAP
jgi:hypothetical protein